MNDGRMDCCGGHGRQHYPSCGSLAAAAASDEAALRPLLASIDNALRSGSYMTNANLALEHLCLRLDIDRESLVFDPLWPQHLACDEGWEAALRRNDG